jgi:hypothetical protein
VARLEKIAPEDQAIAAPPVAEWRGVSVEQFGEEIATRNEPAVLRGAVAHWPAVAAGKQSADATAAYLSQFDRGAEVRAFIAPSEVEGRYFYNPAVDGFNFGVAKTTLSQLVATLAAMTATEHRSIYMGSTPTAAILPGFADDNPLELVAGKPTEPRIWIGNDSRVAAHFDESENIACVTSGRRRFTLFPPEQVANLYVGPIDKTVAGRPTSMVDLANPDFERFPRFREALKHAVVADLEPGDAIYIPSLWWHAVEAEGALNVLVNYWWQDGPEDAGSPLQALGHGLLTISHLPPEKRAAWRAMFDHYVFRADGDPAAHIPEAGRGILGRSTPQLRRVIKQFLLRSLNE